MGRFVLGWGGVPTFSLRASAQTPEQQLFVQGGMPMSKYMIKLDQGRCISCRACEVQCQVKNRAPAGLRPGLLVAAARGPETGRPPLPSAPVFIVKDPGARRSVRRVPWPDGSDDGTVLVSRQLCIGCRACIAACPWKVPQWDESTGKVVKCDGCHERVAQGLAPACVAGCTTHALTFSRANTNVRKTRLLYARSLLVDRKAG